MTPVAQTNLQLFNQLADRDYQETDIARVRDAYVLAMRLFSGLHRSSGKTFVAHAIGTASVLADLRAPAAIVAAAIMHSAYTLGEFGTLRRKISGRKRERVRAAIGPQAEELAYAYALLPWNEPTVRALVDARYAAIGRDRDVLLIRLANEVDDFVDLGALYAANWQRRLVAAESFLPLCTQLAERLSEPELGAKIRCVADETCRYARPLLRTIDSATSLLVPPASHAPRTRIRLRTLVGGLRSGLRLSRTRFDRAIRSAATRR